MLIKEFTLSISAPSIHDFIINDMPVIPLDCIDLIMERQIDEYHEHIVKLYDQLTSINEKHKFAQKYKTFLSVHRWLEINRGNIHKVREDQLNELIFILCFNFIKRLVDFYPKVG